MRFWIVGGGTGGHVYPALAAAQALRDIAPDTELTWIGTVDGMERDLVERANITFQSIPGGGLHGVALRKAIRNGWGLLRGVSAAVKLMRQACPAGILTTGGYVSGPIAVAARYRGVPSLVFVPDIEPASSVKAIARLAQTVAVSVSDSLDFFPAGKAKVTGYPLGKRVTQWDRASGRAALELPEKVRVLLVFGGSRGARSINRAVLDHIRELTRLAHVVHISGQLDWPEVAKVRDLLEPEVREKYRAYAYLHERMGAALAAADLVVSRAGAGVLGEFPFFGLPAILVPYPYAWRYQRVNAQWLADRDAAVVLEDGQLDAEIVPMVRGILQDERRRAEMVSSARSLAHPKAAQAVAQLLLDTGREPTCKTVFAKG